MSTDLVPITSDQGDFFAIDRRAWAVVCEAGLNASVAYLVLACGTGPDNRTTAWSTNAIETYTSISRRRAKEAIQLLEEVGVLERLRDGTKPKYELVPPWEIPGCEGILRPSLDPDEEFNFFDP